MTPATPYDQHNADFSGLAHRAALREIYPPLFACAPSALICEEGTLLAHGERGRVLDGEMGIDRIVAVTVPDFEAPLRFTVQERFRRPEYATYQDLTITAWNHRSGQPSELYKLTADLFVYGYFDAKDDCFLDYIIVPVGPMKRALARGELRFKWGQNPKGQSFLVLTFAALAAADLILDRHPFPVKVAA